MLAVLPFANLSGDPEQEYFSDGMTEEMITRLGRLRPDRLGVIARTSAMRYKNTDKLIDQIGRELGVDHVIEGGVRRAGGSVRINAQLIQVRDQTQLWGDSYTRDLSDVFAVQAEVAEAVAQALALELLPQDDLADEATPTANSAAYDAYLLGRSYWAKRTPDDIETAITHFKRAVQIDPDYALAHAGLADALNVLPWYKPIRCLPVIREAKEAAEKAIAINGRLAEAHAALGGVLFAFREYQESEDHFKTAIAIDPNNATAYQWYSELLSSLGRRLESIQLAREGVARDPQSPVVNLALANALYRARQYEDAIVQLRKIVQLDPDWIPARRIMAETLDHAGRHDEAALAFEECARLWEWKDVEVQGLKDAYRSRGMQGIYEVFYERQAQKGTEPQHHPQLEVLARLGKDDEALALLAQLVDDYEVASNWIGVNPYLDHLHGDPRFDELLRKVGLPKIEIPAASSMP
jgi:TolB-like protein